MRNIATMAVLALAFLAAGCGKKPEPPPPAPVATDQAADREEENARRAAEEAARRAAEEAERLAAEEARRREATLTEMVFFDFDVSAIRDDQKAILDAKIPLLREDPSIRLRIEGHADDRGSTEYNLALGERRAHSVKSYLVGFGLDPSRFETVTYGEERPLVTGQDEVSWARNRRGEFKMPSGIVAERDDGR